MRPLNEKASEVIGDWGEFKGAYGTSENFPQATCRVFYAGQWYAIEGSVNVNYAPHCCFWNIDTEIAYYEESINDTHKSTADHPSSSIEDLQNHLSGRSTSAK